MLRYRSDLQRNLTALEADGNIRHLAEQAQVIASQLLQGAAVEGATLVLTLADGSTMSVVLPAGGGGGGGVGEAPEDNIARARRNADWVPIDVLEAPNDGRAYNRKSKQWAVAESGGAGGTPSTDYPRVRGAWSETLNVKLNDLVEHKGMLWRARGDYGTGTSEPSFGDAGTWMPVSFLPGGVVNDPLTQRLFHRFFVAPSDADPDGRYDTVDVATILNEFERRIKALE